MKNRFLMFYFISMSSDSVGSWERGQFVTDGLLYEQKRRGRKGRRQVSSGVNGLLARLQGAFPSYHLPSYGQSSRRLQKQKQTQRSHSHFLSSKEADKNEKKNVLRKVILILQVGQGCLYNMRQYGAGVQGKAAWFKSYKLPVFTMAHRQSIKNKLLFLFYYFYPTLKS